MGENTNFYNEILSNNQKIVEYYTINPKDVIKLSESENVDAVMLEYLANELKKALDNEELTAFLKTQITRTLVATILAIKKIEKNNALNEVHTK